MLELKNVSLFFSNQKMVLHQLSLQVNDGEFVAIVGRSGAGKTTLLKLFNGMAVPQQGSVWVDGQCLSECSGDSLRKLQQKIAVIYQEFCLVQESTVLQNVLNGALYRHSLWRVLTGCFPAEESERAREALRQVGLTDKAEAVVATLSGGEKQRTAIARALMQQAHIILADEPAASLDPVTADRVLFLLKRLQQERNLTVVMNSHNIQQARQYAERIVGVRQGYIVKDAPSSAWSDADFASVYGVRDE
ncbi:MAG: phosphonate ABC transporter ATP-binding protein [Acidaminococcaceae bacterium]|nr:phosphonate ABC transporter ATP-binding protein [Acidaminococcaceae bacterium]